MNLPPTQSVPLSAPALQAFVRDVFLATGMGADHAGLLSGLLVTNDLRGVFSHGTRQAAAYARHFREKELTPTPEVRVLRETPAALSLDGGGGLGYFPAFQAAQWLAAHTRPHGIAMARTVNHGHFGAAGIYSRIPLEVGLFCYVTSGHQLHLEPGKPVLNAAGGSPMSFALPTGEEPPFVLDFGAMHDLYEGCPHVDEIMRLAPGTVFRSIGLGAVCQALGGFLCGVPVDPARAARVWPGANQGSFMIAVDLEVFMPLEQFRQEMDEYLRRVRQMKPVEGFAEALLPGEPEWRRERRYREEGIPVGPRHAELLRELAAEYGLASPV